MTNWKESKQKFLERWPLEKVKSLTLEEYTNTERNDSFTYWMETRTEDVISMWGGSAYKFGVFKRNPEAEQKQLQSNQKSDGVYGWYSKYGDSPEVAFSEVKNQLIKTIKSAQNEDFHEIDGIDLGHSFKWKIAYMYAPENTLLRFVKDGALKYLSRKLLDKKHKKTSETYRQLVKAKPENESFDDYSSRLWDMFDKKDKLSKATESDKQSDGYKRTQSEINTPLNQILFGPPGTGKTYSSVIKALAIIEENSEAEIETEDYPRLKKRYDQYVKEGQIVFTTFHQSLAYEDFVEGIKPIEPEKEGDSISYKVEEGIFKRLCIEAGFSLAKESNSVLIDHVVDFSLAFDEFSQRIEEKLSSGETVELKTKNGGKVIVDGISSQGNIIVKHVGGSRTYTVSKSRLAKLQEGIDDLEEVSNINDEFRAIIGGSNSSAYWSVLNSIQEQSLHSNLNRTPKKYSWSDKVQVVKSLKLSELSGKTSKPYILIIDEINRGDVSAIFGELITLIELSKRAGNEEGLEIMLPYSKEPFSVPNNLYIIGTMNTADRSVEALDSALRRRFSFIEMPPEPDLIEQESERFIDAIDEPIDLVNLLTVINERIEVLLDRDHLIGHSYFMKVTDIAGLRHAFYNEIIPLLQEYFFGDYGKISMVLGEGFCQAESAAEVKFATVSTHYDDYDYSEKLIYYFPNHETDAEFIDAINKLLNKSGDESQ